MDFRNVKSLAIPEGSVKELRIGGVSVWRKPSAVSYGVTITTDNAAPITDFYVLRDASKTFEAEFNVPASEQNITPAWSITGLPSGLSASGATVSGYAASAGTSTVTVTVTKGSYSDSKQFTFNVTSDGYGVASPSFTLGEAVDFLNYEGSWHLATGITWTGFLTSAANVPSSAGALTYYCYITAIHLSPTISVNSVAGEVSISSRASSVIVGAELLYVYAERYPYRSEMVSIPLIFEAPEPKISRIYPDGIRISVSASEAIKTANVGKELACSVRSDWDTNGDGEVYGVNIGSLHNGIIKIDGQALPCTVYGTGTSGKPVFTVSYEEEARIINDEVDVIKLRFTLTSRYTSTAAALKKLSSTHTLTAMNECGSDSVQFTISYE